MSAGVKQQKPQTRPGQGAEARISGDMSDAAGSALANSGGAQGRLQSGSITYNARLQAMGHYLSLPEPMKRRIRALKKLQFNTLEIEANFYKELHALEMKYAGIHAEQFDKRYQIVMGEREPTDEEANWPEDSEAELQLAALARSVAGSTDKLAAASGDSKGLPGFWLTVLKNVELIGQMIHEHDEPILRHLTDIRTGLFSGEQTGFTLEFHFSQNEYFTNSMLTKQYFTRMSPDRRQPWSYDGPEIYRCRGCDIQWCKGKNVTVKILKKVQRHRGNGQKRTLTKTVETDSFFNFFNPPTQAIDDLNDDDSEDEEIENLLQSDFEIGHFIRERIVSRAVLCFTGEGLDDEDETLKYKWWKDTGICGSQDSQSSKNASPLDTQSIGGIFIVLIGGIAVSALVGIVEFAWNWRKLRRKGESGAASLCSQMCREAKFSMNCFGSNKRPEPQRRQASHSCCEMPLLAQQQQQQQKQQVPPPPPPLIPPRRDSSLSPTYSRYPTARCQLIGGGSGYWPEIDF